MGNIDPVTVLHLSDPQFGKNHAFGHRGQLPSDREADLLRERLVEDLRKLRQSPGLSPDLVVITGDLTEWALPTEFGEVRKLCLALSDALSLSHKRIVVVPGNHDVNRKQCESYFLGCEARESKPEKPYWPKWEFYAEFVNEFYRDYAELQFTKERPWAFFELEELSTVVAAMNSEGVDLILTPSVACVLASA